MCGEAADDLHRRRQDSELEDASFDRTDIAAVTTESVSCDRLDEWRFGVCSLKCQNETAEIALQNTVDRTRRVKTILRYTTRRYSHDSLGHCEEVEKQIRAMISHTWTADHKCDSDRHVAWNITHHMIKAEELTSFFKWMSKDEHGEVAKFDERSWSRSIAKTSKLAEQWNDARGIGKLNRTEEHSFVIKGLNRSVRAGRKQARDEKLNLEIVKAVLSRIWELKASTEIDTSVARQKYNTNQLLHKHRLTPLCTRCAWDTGVCALECRARIEIIWTKEFAEAEVASHAVGSRRERN